MNMKRKFEVLFDEYEDQELARIRIEEDGWEGLIYHYGKVDVSEDGDQATLSFEYDVDYVPENIDLDSLSEEDQKSFETILGDIILQIIEEKQYSHENRGSNTNVTTE